MPFDDGKDIAARVQTGAGALPARLKRNGVDYPFANAGTDFAPVIEGCAGQRGSGGEMPLQAQVRWIQRDEKPAKGARDIHVGHGPLFEALPPRSFQNDLCIAGDAPSTTARIAEALHGRPTHAEARRRRYAEPKKTGADRGKGCGSGLNRAIYIK